jgi:hypothetical protein
MTRMIVNRAEYARGCVKVVMTLFCKFVFPKFIFKFPLLPNQNQVYVTAVLYNSLLDMAIILFFM